MENNLLPDDILELEGIEYYRKNIWDVYKCNELSVPRVTNIISQCRDKSYLIDWAAKIGYNKKEYYQERALEIGTDVHMMIDKYLISKYRNNTKFEADYKEFPERYRENIFNGLENFKLWCRKLEENNTPIEAVLFIEETICCPWYGGTVDAIVRINGANYLIDFKTSKSISNEYLVQVAAYMWIINNGYVPHIPHIDGIGIIRVDKNKYKSFDELFLNEFNSTHNNIIINLQNCFLSYVNSYYRTLSTNYMIDNYKKGYIDTKIFNEVI